MNKILIKICGIRTPEMASVAAHAGAHLIGLIFHPTSPRYVDPDQAKKIVCAVRRSGAEPVAVFVNQNDEEMRRICEIADITTVQLHGRLARQHHHLLPETYKKIVVCSKLPECIDQVPFLNRNRDFILLDHPDPGKGKKLNWQKLRDQLNFPWFLAGGLTPENVNRAIQLCDPNGVDVSSGVESSLAEKDLSRIKQFIQSVKDYYETSIR